MNIRLVQQSFMHHNAENRDQRSKESGLIGDVFQHLMSIETEPNKIFTKKQFDKFKTHSKLLDYSPNHQKHPHSIQK